MNYGEGIQHTEHGEQCALFDWAMLMIVQHPELSMMTAIPNGGFRSKTTAGKLKAEGVKAGVPDIALFVPRGAHHGLFIEMKVGKNTPTPLQKQWHTALRGQGYAVAVCYSFEDARDTVLGYLAHGLEGVK